MKVTVSEACDAVATTLTTVSQIKRVQSYDELTEDFPDCPMAQVFPDSGGTDSMSQNDRSTSGAGLRVEEMLVVVDVPCSTRSELKEDMGKTIEVIEAVKAKLDQQTAVLFGQPKIKGHRWRWERVVFVRGEPAVGYMGVKFYVTLWTF